MGKGMVAFGPPEEGRKLMEDEMLHCKVMFKK